MAATYQDQINSTQNTIDDDFWLAPTGIEVKYDSLKFLYIPDHVSTYISTQVARKIYRYQIDNISTKLQITDGIMITMGGLLPGVQLHDHLAWTLNKNISPINFGTFGVKYYAGPGQPLEEPYISHPVSIDVTDKVVAVVDDLVDLGGTARFVAKYFSEEHNIKKMILIAPFLKSREVTEEMEVIYHGLVPHDTWIITPREKVETLIKRVPHWRNNGASLEDCEQNLRSIGYPEYLIDIYLRATYERG